jgi:hypothetical protein
MILKILRILILINSFLLLFLSSLLAQDDVDANSAPQILTSDLLRKQIVYEPIQTVSFVFVDDDLIERIEINGETQEFKSASTIVITKKYTFKEGRTVITVAASDEQGNERIKKFLVGYGIKDDKKFTDQKTDSEITWAVSVKAAYENDDNPTRDLSSPVKLGDLEIEGVVPDEEQPDTRTTLGATMVVSMDKIYSFAGGEQTNYSKPENDFLNSQAIFFGAGLSMAMSDDSDFLMSYMFLDINVGGEDFAQNHVFSPGLLFKSKDSDGSYKDLIGIDYTMKEFADSQFDAGSAMVLKWTYESWDVEKQDKYYRIFAYGSVNDGTEISEYTFWQMDFDWFNKWDSGFLFDIGTGFQHRTYKNDTPLSEETGLGKYRVDIPFRFSTGLGWAFNPKWKAVYNYKYETNLSNKSPYVRNIHGLTVNGQF